MADHELEVLVFGKGAGRYLEHHLADVLADLSIKPRFVRWAKLSVCI